MVKKSQVIIIGAGPAGIACAMQLKRYGIDFRIIEKNTPGGLLSNAGLIENYPGFPEGIRGIHMISLLKKQLKENQIEVLKDEITEVLYKHASFELQGIHSNYQTAILVIASGTSPKKVFDINSSIRNRVFYEFSPLSSEKNKSIAIIGAGDAAFDYALSFSENNNTAHIFNRGNNIKAIPVLVNRVKNDTRINYYSRHSIDIIVINKNNLKLLLSFKNIKTRLSVDFIIFATGRKPEKSFLSKGFNNEKDLIDTHRLFYIGDVKNGRHRQLSIAAGDGVRCAMEIAGVV